MSESEKQELINKAEQLANTVRQLHFRIHRVTKNIKSCKQECKDTIILLNELNDLDKK